MLIGPRDAQSYFSLPMFCNSPCGRYCSRSASGMRAIQGALSAPKIQSSSDWCWRSSSTLNPWFFILFEHFFPYHNKNKGDDEDADRGTKTEDKLLPLLQFRYSAVGFNCLSLNPPKRPASFTFKDLHVAEKVVKF